MFFRLQFAFPGAALVLYCKVQKPVLLGTQCVRTESTDHRWFNPPPERRLPAAVFRPRAIAAGLDSKTKRCDF